MDHLHKRTLRFKNKEIEELYTQSYQSKPLQSLIALSIARIFLFIFQASIVLGYIHTERMQLVYKSFLIDQAIVFFGFIIIVIVQLKFKNKVGRYSVLVWLFFNTFTIISPIFFQPSPYNVTLYALQYEIL